MFMSENEYTKWLEQLTREKWYYGGDDFDFFGVEVISAETEIVPMPNSLIDIAPLFKIMDKSFHDYFPSSNQKPNLYLINFTYY